MSILAAIDEDPVEVYRLTRFLTTDPSSAIAAAIGGWKHPISREALAIFNVFDLLNMVNSKKKPKPHPRPFPDPEGIRRGKARPASEVVAILNRFGHNLEPPV